MVSTHTPTQAYIPLLLGFIENRLGRHLPPGQRVTVSQLVPMVELSSYFFTSLKAQF